MEGIFSDWQAEGVSIVLHEEQGGYAENMPSMLGLRAKSEALGVRLLAPVTVTGLKRAGGAVTAVETDQGTIACDTVIVAAGPWVRDLWHMLELPPTTIVRGADGTDHEWPTWTYWCLQEGTLGVDPTVLVDNEGHMPPVVHIDTDAPLIDDVDGSLVTEELWGVYYKPDFNFGGVQGGAMPWVVEQPADDVAVDPYGEHSTEYVVTPEFERMWTSALAHCHAAVRGQARRLSQGAHRWHRGVHPGQLPGVRHLQRERSCRRRLQPRLQDDRGGGVGREGGHGAAAGAARAVPLLAVRGGPAAPGQQLALPVELG